VRSLPHFLVVSLIQRRPTSSFNLWKRTGLYQLPRSRWQWETHTAIYSILSPSFLQSYLTFELAPILRYRSAYLTIISTRFQRKHTIATPKRPMTQCLSLSHYCYDREMLHDYVITCGQFAEYFGNLARRLGDVKVTPPHLQ
jgi:hypothetical protein